ncbi:MAG: KTSC domain-containing protein [Chitinophagales bacterium]|nr:KTSC domain-containing protein [Chitinophagales bacterium]
MRYHPVVSTVLALIGYDQDTRKLEVVFRSGSIYLYIDVPSRLWKELLAADSKGKYYNQFIKDKFEFIKKERAA